MWIVQPVALYSQLVSEVRLKATANDRNNVCNGCRMGRINSQLVGEVQCVVKGFRQTIQITSVMAAEWGESIVE
ncbi:hypothetical protein CDAR_202961 [Caerostris darwini]|uniref:Uncharacterized protein n=1 Tax=Caerostris darwini TaxID=1538125 RepID=A0AAV4WA02_9ARAC|nr:hypothetical protein CDAR_202961 [Caerostris darwini]